MKKPIPVVNLVLLIGLASFYVYDRQEKDHRIFEEIKAERLSIVGPDGHLYISISNPERQALATRDGKPLLPGENRDLPGIIFFNRIGDEVGGMSFDGKEDEGYSGISFDQYKDDQILAIVKDEYKVDGEWKRWYGMFLRERSDSITQFDMFQDFYKTTKDLTKEERDKAYQKMRRIQDEEINVYRMFLGREENRDVGLFLYDSKGKERIKIYIDESDNARFEILDKNGNEINGEGILK